MSTFLFGTLEKTLSIAGTMHSSKYKANLLAGILSAIFSMVMIDSFAQSELTTSQDQGSNVTSLTASLGDPLFVEQGRITGQRVLAVSPQPQLETSFMANTSIINNSTGSVVNAINIGTIINTLNDDGTFGGKGQGLLRTKGGDFASCTSQSVGKLASDGNIIVHGLTLWSTPRSETSELAFVNGVLGLFEFKIDREGNLSVREWQVGK